MSINGLRADAVKFPESLRHDIKEVLADLRPNYQFPKESQAERGTRFFSDEHVMWLIESGATEVEMKEDMVAVCKAALHEAGKSDYWYAHEKKWDDDYSNEGEDCQDFDGDGDE